MAYHTTPQPCPCGPDSKVGGFKNHHPNGDCPNLGWGGLLCEECAGVVWAVLDANPADLGINLPQKLTGKPVKKEEPAPPDPAFKAAMNEAIAYIREYTGTWAFILDLRASEKWGTKYYRLSRKQVDVVLKAKARDAERARERAERRSSGLDLTVLPTGTSSYAVENASGELTFIRVDHVDEGKWAGFVFVKQVVGGVSDPRNYPRLGMQKPGDAYKGTFESLLAKVLADPMTAAMRYGTELGECAMCGRTLTNAESRATGIGPECSKRLAA